MLSRLSIIKELFAFLWQNKLWWMAPIVIIFLLMGILIIFAQSSAVMPFIYALF
jgi:NAD/NADP transhydrogenase beta subunit